jgi:excinuclease ABC subunit C
MLNVKEFLKTLTTHPGVYQMLGEGGKVLYVGKARNIKKRVTSYFSAKQKDIKTSALLKHVKDIHITITHTENEALLLECNLIKKYKPHYNILFRDDKSYPYILITDEKPYPSIDFYRGTKKTSGKYFGPYPNSYAVKETIRLIQKLFGLRISSDRYSPNRTRPCLKYQLGLCSGACAGLISVEDYQASIQHAILFLQGKNQQILTDLNQQMTDAAGALQYEKAAKIRNQITRFKELQERQYVSAEQGDVDILGYAAAGNLACIQLLMVRNGRILGSQAYFPILSANPIKEEVLTSFITQHYLLPKQDIDIVPKDIILDCALPERNWLANTLSEQGGYKVTISHHVRGERRKWLSMANASAQQSVASRSYTNIHMQERFAALHQALSHYSSHAIEHIECFDISHTMGEATVASCVVFNNQGPVKSSYRRFNIKGITPGDDVAAIQQVIQRRYQQEHPKIPDLILIDGGPAQLAVANQTLIKLNHSPILLIGVAKGASRKPGLETLYRVDQPPINLPPDSPALHLIQQIRDEAHRFAITGHRQQRDKKRITSVLEKIPGIGAKRRRELLLHFGGIQALTRASLEELEQVIGISQSLAKRIYTALHHDTI